MAKMHDVDLASKIDYTLLKPIVNSDQIKKLCREAIDHGFAAVCVPPYFVRQAHLFLESTKVNVVTVIGFPFGYSDMMVKVEEVKHAIEDGADELDVVMNFSAFLSGNDSIVLKEIQSITTLAHLRGKIVKWIIETGILSKDQIGRACRLASEAEVDFVKTSTGFNGEGATVETVKMLRKILPAKIQIKASGGIKTRKQAMDLIKAGADRIGTSSGVELVGS